jgi:hypothetical protein
MHKKQENKSCLFIVQYKCYQCFTHCLFQEKVDGLIGGRMESLWKSVFPPFGYTVREERKLNFGGPHLQNLSVQRWGESIDLPSNLIKGQNSPCLGAFFYQ